MALQVRRNIVDVRVLAVRNGRGRERSDRVVGEEPLEIRVAQAGRPPVNVAVTMRTPGHDFELAAGFLFTEGLVAAGGISRIAYCDSPDVEQQFNIVTVHVTRPVDVRARAFHATSSCGICGKAALDAVEAHAAEIGPGPEVGAGAVLELPHKLRSAQRAFEKTGGLHAAGLFDPAGDLITLREDVGRHNAVDKALGGAVLRGEMPLSETILMVSGRAGFEIVQKAAVAGIPVVCAVSAPSSLAVDAARRFGMTLVGFVRDSGFNVYTHPQRVAV